MKKMQKAQMGAIIKGIKGGFKVAKGIVKTERDALKASKAAKAAEMAAAQAKAERAAKAAATRKLNAERKAAEAAGKTPPKPNTKTAPKPNAKPASNKTTTKTVKPKVEGKKYATTKKVIGYGTAGAVGYYAGSRKKKSNKDIVNSMK